MARKSKWEVHFDTIKEMIEDGHSHSAILKELGIEAEPQALGGVIARWRSAGRIKSLAQPSALTDSRAREAFPTRSELEADPDGPQWEDIKELQKLYEYPFDPQL